MSLSRQLDTYLSSIYNTVPDVDVSDVVAQLLDSMSLSKSAPRHGDYNNLWSEHDIALITYGDTIVSGKVNPGPGIHQDLDHLHMLIVTPNMQRGKPIDIRLIYESPR